jgi:hypothetical protein
MPRLAPCRRLHRSAAAPSVDRWQPFALGPLASAAPPPSCRAWRAAPAWSDACTRARCSTVSEKAKRHRSTALLKSSSDVVTKAPQQLEILAQRLTRPVVGQHTAHQLGRQPAQVFTLTLRHHGCRSQARAAMKPRGHVHQHMNLAAVMLHPHKLRQQFFDGHMRVHSFVMTLCLLIEAQGGKKNERASVRVSSPTASALAHHATRNGMFCK